MEVLAWRDLVVCSNELYEQSENLVFNPNHCRILLVSVPYRSPRDISEVAWWWRFKMRVANTILCAAIVARAEGLANAVF